MANEEKNNVSQKKPISGRRNLQTSKQMVKIQLSRASRSLFIQPPTNLHTIRVANGLKFTFLIKRLSL